MNEVMDYKQFPSIDPLIMNDLLALSDPDDAEPFMDGLIQLYRTEAPIVSQRLREACKERNEKAIVHFSHKLKGLSRNLGLRRLSEICATIEHTGGVMDSQKSEHLLALSEAELDHVMLALTTYTSQKAA
jgi:HPt (histidine-containing phosphotransfer) domain-containing protein